jgi:hypothetical protein
MSILYGLVHYGIDAGIAVLALIGVVEIAVLIAAVRCPGDIEFEWPEDEGKP